MVPSESDLTEALAEATRAAVLELFGAHPDHRFYYVALVTTGDGHGPGLSAWSHEALAAAVAAPSGDRTAEADAALRLDLQWSYADSPFCLTGEEHLTPVRTLFDARPQVADLDEESEDAADAEFALRLRAMEAALARLDAEGLFGRGEEREGVVLLVEIPSEGDDIERARRLNPPQALTGWLADLAALDRG